MSMNSSLKARIFKNEKRSKKRLLSPGQAHASPRKKRNKLRNMKKLEAEARRKKISVYELKRRKYQEGLGFKTFYISGPSGAFGY